MSKFLFSVLAIAIILTTGCSGKVNVTGTVKYPDGEPLTKGNVFFRNAEGTLAFQGTLKPDGSFALGEIKDGDGIPPGNYSAWIAGANATDYARDAAGNLGQQIYSVIIDPKYESPETSGLKYTIDKGNTRLEITVERP